MTTENPYKITEPVATDRSSLRLLRRDAWQAGYEGRPMPRQPHDIATDPPIKQGDPIPGSSVIGLVYQYGVDARHAEITLESGQ